MKSRNLAVVCSLGTLVRKQWVSFFAKKCSNQVRDGLDCLKTLGLVQSNG